MEVIIFLFYGLISYLIAKYLGEKRQIGIGWAFIFCLLLTPVLGFLIIMLSRKHYQENYPPSKAKKIWGVLISIFGGYSFLEFWYSYVNRWGTDRDLEFMYTSMGVVLLGIYLYQLGKGKNFNKKALTEYDK